MSGKGGLYNPRPVDDTPVNGQLVHGVTSNWAYDHAADLDAHTKNLFEEFLIGEYVQAMPIRAVSYFTYITDRIYAVPFLVARDMTIDRIALEVTTLKVNKIIRLGIYKDNGALYPGELVDDCGTVDVTTTGIKTITIDQALSKGWHWLVSASDDAPIIRGILPSISPLGFRPGSFSTTGTQSHYYKGAIGAGALADPFVAGATVAYSYSPFILVRIASLD